MWTLMRLMNAVHTIMRFVDSACRADQRLLFV